MKTLDREHITENQLRVMEHLARFKFLTVKHMIALGIAKHKQSVYEILRKMPGAERQIYVGRKRFDGDPQYGQRSSVHFLRPKGVQFLVDYLYYEPQDIRYPKQTISFFARDYDHRLAFIDCHIALWKYAQKEGIKIERAEAYFDFTGGNRGGFHTLQALTYIPVKDFARGYIIPDGAFILSKEKKQSFYLLEVAKGRDTRRNMAQIFGHAKALQQGTPTEKYNLKIAPQIMYIFEHEGLMNAVIKRFADNSLLQGVKEHFVFASHEKVKEDFGNNFFLSDKKKIKLCLK